MPDLSQYLSLADLQPFFDDPSGENITEAWLNRYSERLNSIVYPRLGKFFRALKAEGGVIPIPNSAGYRCRLWTVWNNFAALSDTSTQTDWLAATNQLAKEFAHSVVFDITYDYEQAQAKDGAVTFDKETAYRKKIEEFNQGDIPSFVFSHENCLETVIPLLLSFKNWVPEGRCILGGKISPLRRLKPASVQETVLELKTGNLLVNDWFRISEFTKAVECNFQLNSRKDREDQARFYAEKFNFISVSVGNSCAGVYQRGNQLIAGYHDEEVDLPADLTSHGSVCTDLWAATLIEYENLVDIVARTHPDTAKAVVDAYLAEQTPGTYGLMKMTVEPGTYYLYHFGDHGRFSEMAKAAGISLDNTIEKPYFILSKERLLNPSKD